MIFDADFLNQVQKAIDSNNIDFFKEHIRSKKLKRTKNRAIRSALIVSAHKAKHLNKLDELDADIAIINLEDGVAPQFKEVALYAAMLFISHCKENAPLLVVRINPLENGGEKEIALLNQVYPDGIRIPKVRHIQQIERARELIDTNIDLHISVETKEAFRDLQNFGDLEIEACYLGILDLLSELDLPQNILKISNPTIDYVLCKFLIDTKSIGALPISFVFQDYKNLDEFREWCSYEKSLGFEAKGCISPKQVEIANLVFDRSKELEHARYIVERFEEMASRGITGFSDEKFGFIDEPIYKDALNTLRRFGS